MSKAIRLETASNPQKDFLIGSGGLCLRGKLHDHEVLESLVITFEDLYVNENEQTSKVKLPNPFPIRITLNHLPFLRNEQRIIFHKQRFDVDTGLFEVQNTYATHHGKVHEKLQLMIDQKQENQFLLNYSISADESQHVMIQSGMFSTPIEARFETRENCLLWKCEAMKKGTKIMIAEAMQTNFGYPFDIKSNENGSYREYEFTTEPHQEYPFTKVILMSHSDKAAFDNPVLRLERTLKKGIEGIEKTNQVFWKNAWKNSGIEIKGDEASSAGLKQSIYRLISVRPTTDRLLQDTLLASGSAQTKPWFDCVELELFHFYINTDSEAAKHIVMRLVSYLEVAKESATELGFLGAYYSKKTYPPGILDLYHTAIVGKRIKDYVDRSGDYSVYEMGGLLVMIETARFLLAQLSKDGQLKQVVTNDIYHPVVDNEARTNYAVYALFEAVVEALESTRETNKLFYQRFTTVHDAKREVTSYKHALTKLFLPVPDHRGIIPPFDGFEKLKPLDVHKELDTIPQNQRTHYQVLEWPSIFDVIMMYPDRFLKQQVKATFEYYVAKLANRSLLGNLLQAIIGHQFELSKQGYLEFLQSIQIKALAPHQSVIEDVRIMDAFAYFMVVSGYAGIRFKSMYGKATSSLPSSISSLRFRLQHRSKVALIKIGKERTEWTWET
ncbi:MAG: hypothetical protein U1C51_02870 [Candidatus Izemoplasmatales bacterium]|nr:hypothetical protein [Candidatus Izemoplasmatales bacterium]